jgi:hypothetical protein
MSFKRGHLGSGRCWRNKGMHNDSNERDQTWPAEGSARAPFWVFSDPRVYEDEQEKIFRGKIWHYLCLEVDIRNGGDYRTAVVGETTTVRSTPWSTAAPIRVHWSA